MSEGIGLSACLPACRYVGGEEGYQHSMCFFYCFHLFISRVRE